MKQAEETATINPAYTETELQQLHAVLYDILTEIQRVCDILGVKYFLLGGSAIGAYYWDGIIPFDDDIDIGMKRNDYETFLAKAPQLLKPEFFLQWHGTERHMPVFFAKVRRNDTRYVEPLTKDLPIHQGIFIDIMPIDRIPNGKRAQFWHRKWANILNDAFTAKEFWRYPHCGKSIITPPIARGRMSCVLLRCFTTITPKGVIYRLLRFVQTFYNKRRTQCYNSVPCYCDYIEQDDLEQLQDVVFGPLTARTTNHVDVYLHRHYPHLKKYLSDEEIQAYCHKPIELKTLAGPADSQPSTC